MRHVLMLIVLLLGGPASAQTWLFESAQAIPSTDTGWGYITLDPPSGRLFVARRDDGLLVWNTKTHEAVTVENSKGANGVVIVPDVRRGYAAMTDGTVLIFNLDTLKPISREDLGVGDLNQGFY
jgi:outer membrane protein assembly factor BamB